MSLSIVKSSRYDSIDVVRGVAALMVVLEHSLERTVPAFQAFTHEHFSFGISGVTVFLLVSGYVIPFSLERTGSNRKFWISRFFRLYPLYWLSLAVAGLFALNGQVLNHDFDIHKPFNWLANVTMFQQFMGFPHAVGLYWTLTIEMVLYIGCSILFALGQLGRSVAVAWIGLGLGTLGTVVFPLVAHHRAPGGYVFLLLTTLIGTVMFRWSRDGDVGRSAKWLLGAMGAFGIATALVNFREPNSEFSAACLVATWAGAYAIFLASFWLRDRAMPPFLTWLGRISYSIYLLHPVFLELVPHSFGAGVYAVAVVAATVLVSGITYRFLEEPMIALGKRFALG